MQAAVTREDQAGRSLGRLPDACGGRRRSSLNLWRGPHETCVPFSRSRARDDGGDDRHGQRAVLGPAGRGLAGSSRSSTIHSRPLTPTSPSGASTPSWGTTPASATGGVHIYDISDPANPDEIRNFPCNGQPERPDPLGPQPQRGPDLMLLAVDRTMERPACDADRSMQPNPTPGGPPVRFDAEPTGWEGVRVFNVSDGSNRFPGAPFARIEQVHSQYTDCGAHTITANTGSPTIDRIRASSCTCRRIRCGLGRRAVRPVCRRDRSRTRTPTTRSRMRATARSRTRCHRVIQVLEVPLDNPEDTTEIAEPEISYQIPGWPR